MDAIAKQYTLSSNNESQNVSQKTSPRDLNNN